MSGVNPQGCQVFAFKKPSSEERDHNFLWRYTKALPERGRIGIFNRSYYEDVLVVRVHPELLDNLPGKDRGNEVLAAPIRRHQPVRTTSGPQRDARPQILPQRVEEGATATFPGPSRHARKELEVQPRRPRGTQALAEYQEAFENMLKQTSTPWAPWWVIPADNKWITRALVAGIMTRSIDKLGDDVSTGVGRAATAAGRRQARVGERLVV